MKVSGTTLSIALSLAAVGPFASNAEFTREGLPPYHPPVYQQQMKQQQKKEQQQMHPTLAKFRSQLRCPYAHEWLTKGAEKAAIDLGLTTPEKVAQQQQQQQQQPQQQQQSSIPGHHRRRLAASVKGSCNYSNAWSGPTCMEFRGEGWDENLMDYRCGLECPNTVTMGGDGCPKPSDLAGWCLKDSSVAPTTITTTAAQPDESSSYIEATSMMLSGVADCAGNKMACETFVGGTFEAADACGGVGVGGGTTMGGGGGGFNLADLGEPVEMTSGDGTCLLAPGAIGAAHQAGFSNGYSPTCPGTPGEGSPYMWPMAWAADFDTQSMAFGSDDVVWRSQGRTFYRLDKNWKRSDTTYSKGVLRTVGQGPCANINQEESQKGVVGCNTDSDFFGKGDPLTTMIHRGSKMYFITWKNSTNVTVGETDPSLIESCSHLDLMVIGNIRPDWFLDKRGDDTDVQYLGDQHVYYADGNVPRLVKQWRKKDFASQYFTMSVTGNPRSNSNQRRMAEATDSSGKDGVHWPLILNIPGEGFGDDMLQVYTKHELLDDDDDGLFTIIESLEDIGGSCPKLTGGFGTDGTESGSSFGPPQLENHVPSNLEVDPNSWFSNVYTFSTVWQPPTKAVPVSDAEAPPGTTPGTSSMAVTEEGRIRVESCYDPPSQSVRLSVEWKEIRPIATSAGARLPWVSLGYRPGDVCAMTPIGGGDTEIITVSQAPTESAPGAYIGSLVPAAKSLDQTAISSVYQSFWPLEDAKGYSGVALEASLPTMVEFDTDNIQVERSAPTNNNKNNNNIKLTFSKAVESKPEVMHLMYAIGMSHQLGIHTSRGCFDVVEFPTCSASPSAATSSSTSTSTSTSSSSSSFEKVAKESTSSSPVVSVTTPSSVLGIVTGLLSYWFLY